ncbi:complex I subunit 5 family protein [Piscinibacter sp.]|uniref:complex I subunit 5 family protein n=1 Tax=Piscinibacter sp. TaxID=1903157 RepID=UPI002CEA3DF7|nr:proton-conducting transporter membrane subunit [Albitalea sp.]HUG25651.1 proton-conducting transporter membrane subunit [Albitalea sp.]
MNSGWFAAMPLWMVMTSLVTAVLIFLIGEERQRLRTVLNLLGAVVKLVLVAVMLVAVQAGAAFEFRHALLPGLDLVLKADALTLLFATLSASLWLLTTVYAIGYLERSENRARFFGFFSLSVAATMGVAAAGNLFTFFIFYELLTLATWPLVVHRGSAAALRAGAVYLAYTLGGSALLLTGLVGLNGIAPGQDFIAHGNLLPWADGREAELRAGFVLIAAGLGGKAALVPLHGWLPQAMVAPAPVSALLHAVAVVKAGAFGIVRLVEDVFGEELVARLGVGIGLAAVAGTTIVYGSLRALTEPDLKRRLAWSTVSQVSYVVLGVALGGSTALVGGLVHLVHQGLMKITLFFCAGVWAERLGIHAVRDLDGVGRRMRWVGMSFSVAALGMIGLPPVAGFVSKWYLGSGALAGGHPWVVMVLVASTLLNAAYFLPLIHRIWFRAVPAERAAPVRLGHFAVLAMTVPPVITAALAFGVGLLAASPMSPLGWVQLIVQRQ